MVRLSAIVVSMFLLAGCKMAANGRTSSKVQDLDSPITNVQRAQFKPGNTFTFTNSQGVPYDFWTVGSDNNGFTSGRFLYLTATSGSIDSSTITAAAKAYADYSGKPVVAVNNIGFDPYNQLKTGNPIGAAQYPSNWNPSVQDPNGTLFVPGTSSNMASGSASADASQDQSAED